MNEIESMVGKTFLYHDDVVELLDYTLNTGDDGDEFELYLNNGTVVEGTMDRLAAKLAHFKPATARAVQAMTREMIRVCPVQPGDTKVLYDEIMDTIRKVKEKKDYIPQARAVVEGVKTCIELKKTEIETVKLMQSLENGMNIKR